VISAYCQIYCEIRGGEGVAGDGKSIYFPNFFESHPLRHFFLNRFRDLAHPTVSYWQNYC
jgi:hypothetical protein